MALPPPIPLRPTDRPETWDEYQGRRRVLALWRAIGDFVTREGLCEAMFAPYKSELNQAHAARKYLPAAFRAAVEEVDGLLRPELGWSVTERLAERGAIARFQGLTYQRIAIEWDFRRCAQRS